MACGKECDCDGDCLQKEQSVRAVFPYLVEVLRREKPNDRSERDRYWAIVITEVEKARAVFEMYALKQAE